MNATTGLGAVNPVAVPAYADPLLWTIAIVALFFEVWVPLRALRRFGLVDPHFAGPLSVINLCTWIPLLVALDAIDTWPDDRLLLGVAVLELAVFAVETVLLYHAVRGRFFSKGTRFVPLGVRPCAVASAVGNVVSLAISAALPAAIYLSSR